MVHTPLRCLWLAMMVCVLLGALTPQRAWAATLVHPGQAVTAPAAEDLQPVRASDDGGEANPWDAVLWGPMYMPFPWSALLEGYAPWGRYAWVKNLTAGCLVFCGSCMIGIFPVTLLFAVISLALAVLALAAAAYLFLTEGFKGGCCGVAGRGADVSNDCFSVFNGIMCLSYVMCTPWLGFKLIQRGWYAIRTPIDPPLGEEPPESRNSREAERQGLGESEQPAPQPAPESMRAQPGTHHALAY
jgi:hypothetical protein